MPARQLTFPKSLVHPENITPVAPSLPGALRCMARPANPLLYGSSPTAFFTFRRFPSLLYHPTSPNHPPCMFQVSDPAPARTLPNFPFSGKFHFSSRPALNAEAPMFLVCPRFLWNFFCVFSYFQPVPFKRVAPPLRGFPRTFFLP